MTFGVWEHLYLFLCIAWRWGLNFLGVYIAGLNKNSLELKYRSDCTISIASWLGSCGIHWLSYIMAYYHSRILHFLQSGILTSSTPESEDVSTVSKDHWHWEQTKELQWEKEGRAYLCFFSTCSFVFFCISSIDSLLDRSAATYEDVY